MEKGRPECFERRRLRAAFGQDWKPTNVKDVTKNTLFSKIYRSCNEWQGREGRGDFLERMAFVRRLLFMTIENGWAAGLGPPDKPYRMCCDGELECGCSGCEAPF